jgi:tetratricopeptide (TPR) repeat protein
MTNQTRPQREQNQEKKTASEALGDFLRKYRLPLLGTLGAIVAVTIAIAVGTGVHQARIRTSTLRVEKIESDFESWSSEAEETRKAALETSILGEIDALTAKWPRFFAAQRARVIRAKIAESKKDWSLAESEWVAAADVNPSSYLAPIALQGAAYAAEERGAPEKAAEYYTRINEKSSAGRMGVPHAYFSLGRIAEGAKDYSEAVGHYEKLVAAYPGDDWTKLAKDRILFLKSRGLAK